MQEICRTPVRGDDVVGNDEECFELVSVRVDGGANGDDEERESSLRDIYGIHNTGVWTMNLTTKWSELDNN